MTGWGAEELTAIGGADEVQVAPDRRDGTPGRATTIWVVRVGNDVYIRSFRGPSGGWYRRAIRARHGTLRAGRVHRRVSFDDTNGADLNAQIDEAYRTKYGLYGSLVRTMVLPATVATTLRLRPAE